MIDLEKYFYDHMLLTGANELDPSIFINYMNKRDSLEDVKNVLRNRQDEISVLKVLRYAFEYYLAWSPEYTMDHISVQVLEKLKLYKTAKNRITYPPELQAPNSPWLYYLVCQMYPDRFTYDSTAAVEAFYDTFLTTKQREKTIFDASPEGRKRAYVCLLCALRKDGLFTAEDAYARLTAAKVKPWLTKYKLKTFCEQCFGDDAVEFLHAALPKNEENERAYNMAKYQVAEKENKARLRRIKTT